MSLKLTTSLSQRLVLTPQLRQRIEMLQMTTLELTDLIQQQILENPVLEEVATQEEVPKRRREPIRRGGRHRQKRPRPSIETPPRHALRILTSILTLAVCGGTTGLSSGGEGGIRTHGWLPIGGFQDRCHKPLDHLS